MPIRRRDLIAGTAGLALWGGTRSDAFAEDAGDPGVSDVFINGGITRWDAALPVGNGLMGGMIWGADREVRISLDRSDLWDLRTPPGFSDPAFTAANLLKIKAAGDERAAADTFVKPFADVLYPTKIPAGRLVIGLREGQTTQAFHLGLEAAEAHVNLGGGNRLSAFLAAGPGPGVLFLRIAGPLPDLSFSRPKALAEIGGYPDALFGGEDRALWMTQAGPEGSGVAYALVADSRRVDEETHVAVVVVRASDPDAHGDPVAYGRRRAAEALTTGIEAARRVHVAAWSAFWNSARVRVPDARLQAVRDRARYFYGACSRPGAPPIALQGVWTDDSGGPPPRRGEYRNDLSVPLSYLAYAPEGLAMVGDACFFYFHGLTPAFQTGARAFFGSDAGIVIPTDMALDGKPLPGLPAAASSMTAGAWMGVLALRHVRYGFGGPRFLPDQAYPFAAAVARGLLSILKPDAAGKLALPLSSSPEYGGETLQSLLPPTSNWDLALLHALFAALAETAAPAGHPDDANRWRETLGKLPPLNTEAQTGALLIAPGVPYTQSVRHLGHAVAIYPLGLISAEGSAADRRTVTATLASMKKAGTDFWAGYTYAWYAAMNARAGQSETAFIALDNFARGFLSRNGMHIGGDQSGRSLSRLTNRTLSLEGNFLALEAIHEMLLQSWGGVVRVFPAVTQNWLDVSFNDLRAEGGFRVTAVRKGGRTVQVRVTAGEPAKLRLRNPFGASSPRWNHAGVHRDGGDYSVTLARGETVEGSV